MDAKFLKGIELSYFWEYLTKRIVSRGSWELKERGWAETVKKCNLTRKDVILTVTVGGYGRKYQVGHGVHIKAISYGKSACSDLFCEEVVGITNQ